MRLANFRRESVVKRIGGGGGRPQDAAALIINAIIDTAYREGASHITFEPGPEWASVYLTGENERRLLTKVPAYAYADIVPRISVLANMKPNDVSGLIEVRMEDQKNSLFVHYNWRVQMEPSPQGEEIILTYEEDPTLWD